MTKVLGQTLNLKNFTTLKVGGPAEVWEVETLQDLQEATKQPYKVIGAGSNLLVSDDGVKERVIKLGHSFNSLKKFTNQQDIWLGASTPLPGLIRRAQVAGLSGLEGLLGVPAVLGGAIAMNAGTRFGEMSDTLQEVEVFVNGGLERLPASALGLRYRHSDIPTGAIITRARLQLTESTPENVQAKLDQVDAARKGQPKQKSAGCAFKNPPSYSAGKLIDEAGLKGITVGDAMVSFEHGNFIVNLGNASAKDVLALLDLIRQRIKIQHGDAVALETEWQLWGF
jgi:UDP-N-acetylmuramate dehydrogenase